MTAFAEAEKAADWVMQRHPIQLEAAAKLSAEGQGMSLTHGSDVGMIKPRDTAYPAAQFPVMVQPMIERPGLQMG